MFIKSNICSPLFKRKSERIIIQMERRHQEGVVYYVELNDDGSISYPKENILQIMVGDHIVFHINAGSPISLKPYLRINQPQLGEDKLYHKSAITLNTLKKRPSMEKLQDKVEQALARIEPTVKPLGGIEFEVEFTHPGSFFYQIEYFDTKLKMFNFTRPDWIVVHPRFITRHGEFTAESMIIQTIFCRCLGKVQNWPKVFETQSKLGYNAAHFVPIQKYGISGSLYSLKDQLSIDDWYVDDPNMPAEERLDLVKSAIGEIKENLNIMCFIDIVLNHTAVNSEWLVDHPDSAYNLHNCPYLKVAWEFDKFLADFSELYSQRKVPECPSAPYIANESDLRSVINAINGRLKTLPLEKYFLYDNERIKGKFEEFLKTVDKSTLNELKATKVDMVDYIIKHSFGYGHKPYGVDVDIEKVGAIILAKSSKRDNPSELRKELNGYLEQCNSHWRKKYEGFMQEALKCIEGAVRYEKLELKNTKLTHDNILVKRYFTQLKGGSSTRDPDEFIVAHNGWTMVTEDFAAPLGFHYLRRLIVVWDDSVKLYYGSKKEDSPYLWSHMEKYVGAMASIFQGMRIDNCHSTPMHVLEYFVNYARSINPSLFVFAELFSKDAQVDASYARRIGLNALLRESIYIGNAYQLAETINKTLEPDKAEYYLPDGRKMHLLTASKPKALLYDITHDNPGPMEHWNPQAILPLVCSLSMVNGSIGTTRGVDEFFPKNLSVISEKRLYQILPDIEVPRVEESKEVFAEKAVEFTYVGDASKVALLGTFNNWKMDVHLLENTGHRNWKTSLPLKPGKYHYKFVVNGKDWVLGPGPMESDASGHTNNVVVVEDKGKPSGGNMLVYDDLRPVRKIMNEIHAILGQRKTTLTTYAMDDIIVVKRVLEEVAMGEESGFVLIARTNFSKGWGGMIPEGIEKTVTLPGKLSRVLLTCNLYVDQERIHKFAQDPKYVTGVKGQLFFHLAGSGLKHFARVKSEGDYDSLEFFKMPSSLCIIVTTKFSSRQAKILSELQEIEDPPISDLSMGCINHILFRCNPEEQEFSKIGRTVYEFRGIAPKYAGIAGLMHEFNKCKNEPAACNVIFENIKEGNWLIDYHLKRISEVPELRGVYEWLLKYLASVKELPPHIRPKWFVFVISKLFYSIWSQVLKTAPSVFKSDLFCSTLLLSTYQFLGNVPSAAYRNYKDTMAAGLPHFATGFMRCWGRDTMIALRGLLLIPKRFKEARDILLMFASVTRHGLIPNLHDRGNNTRFNARDATWFFMEALQEYVNHDTYHGGSIFQEKIELQFLDSNQAEHFRKVAAGEKVMVTLAEIVQGIMQAHAQGIDFVEWNAGQKIDAHMTKDGFHVKIWLDPKTGFVHGGNKFNCGTWMDKLGSSDKAKNKGMPATPRDGADVEIVGLVRSAVKFLSQKYEQGVYPYEGVKLENSALTYRQWGELIDANFEKYFWVPNEPSEWSNYAITQKYVQQTGIYKDVVGSCEPWTEYRFRPNFAIAMAVAPEMFNPEHARYALDRIESGLFEKGALGLKTLHPGDKAYRPKYMNNDDSADYTVAHGFSYHMGPEWVWPIGYFLRALSFFRQQDSVGALEERVMRVLECHRKHILSSPWMSLPEITDAHNQVNPFGCPAQAWSVATVIEAIYDFTKVMAEESDKQQQ
eukprot:TRINITY_DN135298_c0_g1_i1.p1 TRINITY_DN135298_c0_g1~~TRINITY_DN135298_c0_g1_i1.p1  ORF type:complete len:1666 (-),score=190.28 TRINITY_DN135298_c0_g1_i1:86-5026(-)